jgi:hypothetical protein
VRDSIANGSLLECSNLLELMIDNIITLACFLVIFLTLWCLSSRRHQGVAFHCLPYLKRVVIPSIGRVIALVPLAPFLAWQGVNLYAWSILYEPDAYTCYQAAPPIWKCCLTICLFGLISAMLMICPIVILSANWLLGASKRREFASRHQKFWTDEHVRMHNDRLDAADYEKNHPIIHHHHTVTVGSGEAKNALPTSSRTAIPPNVRQAAMRATAASVIASSAPDRIQLQNGFGLDNWLISVLCSLLYPSLRFLDPCNMVMDGMVGGNTAIKTN